MVSTYARGREVVEGRGGEEEGVRSAGVGSRERDKMGQEPDSKTLTETSSFTSTLSERGGVPF